jgi:hypothetical protein
MIGIQMDEAPKIKSKAFWAGPELSFINAYVRKAIRDGNDHAAVPETDLKNFSDTALHVYKDQIEDNGYTVEWGTCKDYCADGCCDYDTRALIISWDCDDDDSDE